jgi:hypothetical protein
MVIPASNLLSFEYLVQRQPASTFGARLCTLTGQLLLHTCNRRICRGVGRTKVASRGQVGLGKVSWDEGRSRQVGAGEGGLASWIRTPI